MTRFRITALAALLVLTSGAWAIRQRLDAESKPVVHNALGDKLPEMNVQTPEGKVMRLRDRIGQHPALIYLFDSNQCAGCSNLSLEFRILKSAYPNLRPLLVGSGSSRAVFEPAFEQMGVANDAVIDEPRTLLHALRMTHEPVVLLTDSAGRIVFVDVRSASQAAQFPMGRVLSDLSAVLDTSGRSGSSQTSSNSLSRRPEQ